MSKHNFIKDTLFLTAAGFITRILGFFYRIWLSGELGAEMLGIYQLVFPIYGICYTIFGAGLQSAISKTVAENNDSAKYILKHGMTLSFSVSAFLSVLLYILAPFIAKYMLFEARAVNLLCILAFAFPFASISACINGYNYGLQKSTSPALSQITEQLVRILTVLMLAVLVYKGSSVTCEAAVIGVVSGEAVSALYSILSFNCEPKGSYNSAYSYPLKTFHSLAVFISTNRLVLSLLHSFEAVLIPALLRKNGLSTAESLSSLGIISGMVMPFILFPTAFTNSLSLLLLPAVGKAVSPSGKTETERLQKAVSPSLMLNLGIGILSMFFFMIFGKFLGVFVFHEDAAGLFLQLFSLGCPFIYLSSSLSSILNGLSMPQHSFRNSCISMTVRVVLVCIFIPMLGLLGYFIGFLASEILLVCLNVITIKSHTKIKLFNF